MDFNLCGPLSRIKVVAELGSDVTAAEPKPGWGRANSFREDAMVTG